MELARSLELRSGAYHAPALPVELCQRSWRGDSNADHGLTRPALFPLSYTSTNSGGGGENCTPDDLLCRQTPCCLGYTASKTTDPSDFVLRISPAGSRFANARKTAQPWSGVRELHPCFRTGDPGYCSYTNSAWSEQRESNSRHRVGNPRHQPLYHARSSKSSGRGDRIRTCLNSFWRRAPFPSGHHPCGGRNGS